MLRIGRLVLLFEPHLVVLNVIMAYVARFGRRTEFLDDFINVVTTLYAGIVEYSVLVYLEQFLLTGRVGAYVLYLTVWAGKLL